MGYFYSIVNTCASKWMRNGKLKLKLVRSEKKKRVYDAQTRKNANTGYIHTIASILYVPQFAAWLHSAAELSRKLFKQ